jgi:ankyrin repeat protein
VTAISSHGGQTALHLAAGSGSVDCTIVVSSMLPPSAQAALDVEFGWPPLFFAVQQGDVATVKALLEQDGAVSIAAVGGGAHKKVFSDKMGTTAMHIAALNGHTEVVQLLYERGHPIDCVDNAGWPPLLYADYNVKRECVLSLMRPNPEQLAVVGKLLHHTSAETLTQAERNRATVVRLIHSLATVPVSSALDLTPPARHTHTLTHTCTLNHIHTHTHSRLSISTDTHPPTHPPTSLQRHHVPHMRSTHALRTCLRVVICSSLR